MSLRGRCGHFVGDIQFDVSLDSIRNVTGTCARHGRQPVDAWCFEDFYPDTPEGAAAWTAAEERLFALIAAH